MAQQVPGIESHPDRQGGEPCIADTRVPVRAVHEAVGLGDRTSEEVSEAFRVSLGDIYRALAYYYDHPDEMERIEREREQAKQESIKAGASTLEDLCREYERE